MLTIQNSSIKISVTKIGAELCSLFSKEKNVEFMWQANPTIWGSHAPVLFPIIGCLKDGIFLFEGNTYSVPKHGFIRNNATLESNIISENFMEFRSKYTEETLKNYPFNYEFIVRYILQENGVKVEHTIINHDTQNPMYFSLGGHPGFKCPFFEHEKYEDYYIEFEVPETDDTWLVSNEGLIENAQKKIQNKHCDWIVANNVADKSIGFNSDYNEVFLISKNKEVEKFNKTTKSEIAKIFCKKFRRANWK